ncbi:MAG TPA: DUF2802 domain-containing protein [Thiobacillaceae bacterium]|nr:DUF2802 domain-containing protein [Thiobacillaceae bacterium]HNF88414.1 DUF2802 domain-containing protein [Thiobacillaceae bacterium]HNH89491.1 DUF2802 domain-containing protein [Thiobacillaceae bacterium]HNI06946.1 DUF2802 domain-containing protein [Thiobacillaceae bacterium]
MLEDLTFSGKDLLIAVVLGTLVYLLETVLFSRRPRSKSDPEIPRRLDDMEAQLTGLKDRLEALEARPPVDSGLDTRGALYADALRMAMDGNQPQELVARLGISRGEAELIIALNKAES